MPKFAANLTMLFTELPFLERFKAASDKGFEFVEYLFPYDWSTEALTHQLKTHHLTQVLFNLPPGDWAIGERGIACLPDRIEEFKQGVDLAIEYAKALGVKQINCLAGIAPKEVETAILWQTLASNVTYAAQKFQQHDLTLLIEPINSKVDMPEFFIDNLEKAIQLITEVNEANVKIQFDIYHMQIMQGNILRSLEHYLPLIGHIQFADCPGRHEPGTGELNFTNIFKQLDALNYAHYLSAEYIPKQNTSLSLQWFSL